MATKRPLARHLAELLAEMAARQPTAPAVADGEKTLTYAELDERVTAAAGGLYQLGIRRGASVGLLCTNRWEWLSAALGAQRLGARVAAFNTFAKAWDLEYMLAHSRAQILVCVDRFRARDYRETLSELIPELGTSGPLVSARFEHLREVVIVGDAGPLPGARSFSELLLDPPAVEPELLSAVDDAFVLYTSGSTARPKAVPLQHYGLIENAFHIGERMGLTNEDRVFLSAPMFWAYGAANAVPATLTHGGQLVLQAAFEPIGALELIDRHKCTAIYTLPNMTGALLGAEGFTSERVASIRTGLTLGSEAEFLRTARELGVPRICNIYGGTETYGNCCVTPADWPLERRATGQGPPLPGVRIRIEDQQSGELLGPGSVGEIQVTGYVARGYLDDSSGAGAAFGQDGWYRTGDLGWLDEENTIHFSSRATEMIKTGGINVAPREVEEFLALHPSVREAAVVGAPDERLAEVVVAFVVTEAGATASGDELRTYCAQRIAAYKVPARVHVLSELPMTDTGKLARRRLVELDQEAVGTVA